VGFLVARLALVVATVGVGLRQSEPIERLHFPAPRTAPKALKLQLVKFALYEMLLLVPRVTGDELEVLDGVVLAIAVLVVNDLVRFQRPTEVFGHYVAVLEDNAVLLRVWVVRETQHPIAVRVQMP
jgi:hypothetical protein